MAISFDKPRKRRRLYSLTPMIDVVFLLLIFFMLASRFSAQGGIGVGGAAGGETAWQGPPRLLVIGERELRFNGRDAALETLIDTLVAAGIAPDDVLLVRAGSGADVQRLTSVLDALRGGGYGNAVLLP